MNARRWIIGVLLTLGGAFAATACVASLSSGMRDVMKTDGGVCASGGPYVIAHQCSTADIHLVMVGIMGGLVAALLYVIGTATLTGRALAAATLLWAALFGLLGWNFISSGQQTGSKSTGYVFLVMAAGGLLVALYSVISSIRDAGGSGPAPTSPLVRAAVPSWQAAMQPAGAPQWQAAPGVGTGMPVADPVPGPATRASVALRFAVWVLVSLGGAGTGILMSSSVIAALR
jgi:hypothetical protein